MLIRTALEAWPSAVTMTSDWSSDVCSSDLATLIWSRPRNAGCGPANCTGTLTPWMLQLTLDAPPAPRIPVPKKETTTCAFALRTMATVEQTSSHWYTATGVCTFPPLTLTAVAAAGPVPLESALKRDGATGLMVTVLHHG